MYKTTFEHRFNIGDVVWGCKHSDDEINKCDCCGRGKKVTRYTPEARAIEDIHYFSDASGSRGAGVDYEIGNSVLGEDLLGTVFFVTEEECQKKCDEYNNKQSESVWG